MHSARSIPVVPSARVPASPRRAVDFVMLWLCVAVLTLAGLVMGWQFWHLDRIYSGVQVAGVPVGGYTLPDALSYLQQTLTESPLPAVVIQGEGQTWTLSAEELGAQTDLTASLQQAYALGRNGPWPQRLADQAAAMLGQRNIPLQVVYDPQVLRATLTRIAQEVERPPQPPVTVGNWSAPARPGLRVDVAASLQAVLDGLARGENTTVELVTYPVDPGSHLIGATDVAATPDMGAGLSVPQPLVLRSPDGALEFALDPAQLTRILPSGDPAQLDEDALRAIVEGWAEQVAIPPQDARLYFDEARGQLEVIRPSAPGRRLAVDATLQAVRQALERGERTAPLPVVTVSPAVDSSDLERLGIRELISQGTTYFRGSSPARVWNIQVAASKFEGVVIPPGEIFSFNEIVEDVSAANGFEDSLIIWGDRTAVGVGGGVCQVSTTVFRAAYFGGFPIVERYNHGYVVDWYGKPGLDATIYTPTVDFKFRNDTGAYLLVQPEVDPVEGVITFKLFGTPPDRQVTVSEPQISNVVDPGPPEYIVDEGLAPGQVRQAEWPKEGMTVVVERTITENGITRVEKLRSVYQPWNAVYLVGPGTSVPGQADTGASTP